MHLQVKLHLAVVNKENANLLIMYACIIMCIERCHDWETAIKRCSFLVIYLQMNENVQIVELNKHK